MDILIVIMFIMLFFLRLTHWIKPFTLAVTRWRFRHAGILSWSRCFNSILDLENVDTNRKWQFHWLAAMSVLEVDSILQHEKRVCMRLERVWRGLNCDGAEPGRIISKSCRCRGVFPPCSGPEKGNWGKVMGGRCGPIPPKSTNGWKP